MNKRKISIAIVDGQGGGIGKSVIEQLRPLIEELPVGLIALGTNSTATNKMIKAGAHTGATGENAIIFNIKKADIIVGVVGILMANALMGELTPKIAKAVGESDGVKVLIPMQKCNIIIPGCSNLSIKQQIDNAVAAVVELVNEIKNNSDM